MIDEADPGLQAEMIDTDIAGGPGAVHTPGLKDLHPIQGGLGDNTQETDDHPTGGESIHPILQTGSPIRDRDLQTEADILIDLKATPLLEGLPLNAIDSPTHWITNITSIPSHLIPEGDISSMGSSSFIKVKFQNRTRDVFNSQDS